jgi:protein-S-isoprenylcysteine O-methyltransferase Ste14
LGRTWCSLDISGRKKRELVTVGPYALVRNPLYIFTLLEAFGIGAQSGSMLSAGWFAAPTRVSV